MLAGLRPNDRCGGKRHSRGGEGGRGEDADVAGAGAAGAGWDDQSGFSAVPVVGARRSPAFRWGRSREGGSPREPLAADGVAVFECCAASTRHPVCTEGQRIAAPSRCPIFGSEMEADLSVHPRSVRPCPPYAQERQPVGVVSTGMSTSRAVAWPVRSAGQPVTMPRRGLAVPGAAGCWLAARGSLPWLGSRSQDRR